MLVFTPIMMINYRHKMGGFVFVILIAIPQYQFPPLPFFWGEIMAAEISVEECILACVWMNM